MSPAVPSSGRPGARQVAIVTARDEADRIGATVEALAGALPGVHVIVADDGSSDETSLVAMRVGAEVVARGRPHGKGGAASAAALSVLELARRPDPPVFVFCDGDLGSSASALATLVDAVEGGRCDLAVAAFSRRQGGGFGLAVGFARWAIRNLAGRDTVAPISGQRAMTAAVLQDALPFAPGFGMEIGMTVDALRAGHELCEVELDLEHRATGRTPGGFGHRAKQLRDFVRVYVVRKLKVGSRQ